MQGQTRKNSISVGMTTYNSEKYVIEQLESIFHQSVKPDEIVICDDKSTDRTVDIIRKYAEQHTEIPIHFYINLENIGFMKNFEKSFKLCRGDIILPCDSDDVWCVDKVKRIVEVFEDDDVVYMFHEVSLTDEHLNVTKQYFFKDTRMARDYLDPEQTILRDIQRQGIPNGMATAFRRSLLDEVGPFYIEHDGWIDICASLYGKVVFIPDVLAFYRRHSGTLTGRGKGPIQVALKQTRKQRFHMSPVLVEGFNAYLERFEGKLSKRIIKELKERTQFEKTLTQIVTVGRLRACILLLGLYKKGYKKYRGTWKLLMADLLNVVTHNSETV